MGKDAKRLLTADEVAARLRLSTEHVRRLMGAGVLPAFRVGTEGSWRMKRAALERWVEQSESAAAARARSRSAVLAAAKALDDSFNDTTPNDERT